jgi:hypothetical protein
MLKPPIAAVRDARAAPGRQILPGRSAALPTRMRARIKETLNARAAEDFVNLTVP